MTWPLPAPDALAEQAAAQFQAAFPAADPRAPNSVMAVLGRIQAMGLFDLYLYQRTLADELMPDTAVDWLERHADVWGITRLAASFAAGTVSFVNGAGGAVSIPALTEVKTGGGVSVFTQAVLNLAASATGSVAVQAAVAGSAGNIAAASVVTLVSPIAGLTTQAATVDSGGLTGGLDRETDTALRTRLLAYIRARPKGGAAADYDVWARTVSGVAFTSIKQNWTGYGTVGVVVMMQGGVVPTSPQLAAVAAAIEPYRPVTAQVQVIAGSQNVIPVSVQVRPDTAATRAAITTALGVFFAADAQIGGTLYRSRLDEAISSASGEYNHIVSAPSADVVMSATQLPVLGTITWVP